jgi:hypothetical protein
MSEASSPERGFDTGELGEINWTPASGIPTIRQNVQEGTQEKY